MNNMNNIVILGAGTWGIALARMLSKAGKNVTVWSALSDEIVEITKNRRHRNLPNVDIPSEIIFTDDLEKACQNQDIILIAVPSIYVRSIAKRISDYVSDGKIIVNVFF